MEEGQSSCSSPETQASARRLFWAVLVGATLLRLLIAGTFGLSADESHYVMYARRLAWGYFDHPPMVGFLGALGELLGGGVWAARLGPVLCWAGALYLLRRLALALYGDERVAAGAVVVLALMPMQQMIGMALLPDATLNLFWCGALLAGWHALRTERWSRWLLAGACIGGALLSKYHAVLLGAGLGIYIVFSGEGRRALKTPKPYAAALVAFLVFAPNVFWNATHGWVSYKFQLAHGGGSGRFELQKLANVIGGQMAAASPVLAVLLVIALVRLLRGRGTGKTADRYVALSCLVVALFFAFFGAVGKILPHWPAVGWWPGALAVAVVTVRALDAGSVRWRRWAWTAGILAALMSAVVYLAAAVPVTGRLYDAARTAAEKINGRFPSIPVPGPFKPEYDLSNDVHGWPESARQVENIMAAMPMPGRTFVFCHRFYATSQLGVHLSPGVVATTLRRRPSQYMLWFEPAEYRGWDALFVDENHDFRGPDQYASLFEKVDSEPVRFETLRGGKPSHIFHVYRCYGFAGRVEGGREPSARLKEQR